MPHRDCRGWGETNILNPPFPVLKAGYLVLTSILDSYTYSILYRFIIFIVCLHVHVFFYAVVAGCSCLCSLVQLLHVASFSPSGFFFHYIPISYASVAKHATHTCTCTICGVPDKLYMVSADESQQYSPAFSHIMLVEII